MDGGTHTPIQPGIHPGTQPGTHWALPAGRWRPQPVPAAALALHGAAPFAVLAWPGGWAWVLAALGASHAAMGVLGLWPSSPVAGRTVTRLPDSLARAGAVALTFDDGPDPAVTPRVLDMLDRHGARATFFMVGRRAAMHPALVREVARRGHQVESHTWGHHPWFACLGLRGTRREVERAQAVLAPLAGRTPRFLRAPMGLRSPLLDPVLHRAGLLHVSWTRRGLDGISQDPRRVLARLLRGLRAGDILLLHDVCGRHGAATVLDVLPDLLRELDRRALKAVTLDGGAGPGAGPAPWAAATGRPAPAGCAST